jgi:hypothetical protein
LRRKDAFLIVKNSEEVNTRKLADIIFSAALSFKIPSRANTEVRLVVHIPQNLSTEVVSTSISNKITNILSSKLSKPADMLNAAILSAKNFLEATTQQQAADLISIQESLKQQGELIADMVDKGLSGQPSQAH